jgi:hypothetical protein
MKGKTVEVMPGTYNLKKLAEMYAVCTKTMAKRIKSIEHELGDRTGRRLFFIKEVEIIFKFYGTPRVQQREPEPRMAA